MSLPARKKSAKPAKFPNWLKKKFSYGQTGQRTRQIINRLNLHTVCQSAVCPNQAECFSMGTATFLILGNNCTRNCNFCAVASGRPDPVDVTEPQRISEAVKELDLKHVVITSVTRDDLDDGGASQFAAVITQLKKNLPEVTVEVLTPDFKGNKESVSMVIEAGPDIFNHNVETVPRLYKEVRPGADYQQSLQVLKLAGELGGEGQGPFTKSGLMLGLGETDREIEQVMRDLRGIGCQILTLGQYLRPSKDNIEVVEFITPEKFKELEQKAYSLDFKYAASGPFVRSSYLADQALKKITQDNTIRNFRSPPGSFAPQN